MTLAHLAEHYARLASHPDRAIRQGWADYLRERMRELERQWPGITEAARERAREMRAA